jgi:hypothetical protein
MRRTGQNRLGGNPRQAFVPTKQNQYVEYTRGGCLAR